MFPPAKRKRVPAKSQAARGYPVAKVNAASYAARGILQNQWKPICFRLPALKQPPELKVAHTGLCQLSKIKNIRNFIAYRSRDLIARYVICIPIANI